MRPCMPFCDPAECQLGLRHLALVGSCLDIKEPFISQSMSFRSLHLTVPRIRSDRLDLKIIIAREYCNSLQHFTTVTTLLRRHRVAGEGQTAHQKLFSLPNIFGCRKPVTLFSIHTRQFGSRSQSGLAQTHVTRSLLRPWPHLYSGRDIRAHGLYNRRRQASMAVWYLRR
jgi:hypothetical protein